MSRDTVKEFEHAGFTIRIDRDDDPQNCRTDWDNVESIWMMPWSGYRGDENAAAYDYPRDYQYDFPGLVKQMEAQLGERILALAIDEHQDGSFTTDANCRTGESFDGIVYVTVSEALSEFGVILKDAEYGPDGMVTKQAQGRTYKIMTARAKASYLNSLRGAVLTYSDYNTGNVYGFVIEDEDGEHVDSCWGFYPNHAPGEEDEWYCEQEAKSSATSHRKLRDREAAQAEQDRKARIVQHTIMLDAARDFWMLTG